ncbi:MAG: hypothetical protein NC400_07480 [Clostridium sp.]|nr:hypothetical protein [Clostridium sp.]
MKRLIALTLAGVMLCALPVSAAGSNSAGASSVAASAVAKKAEAKEESSESTYSAPAAVEASGVPASVEAAAAAAGKSVGEYVNNAVVEVPGLSEVVPFGQGGHVIINGAPSNVTFFLTKPSAAVVASAKNQAAALGGKVLNVVGTTSQIVGKFSTAQVNFYAKGVKAGQLIKVYQLVNGQWAELTVAEIREDHVVVNMTSHGMLAFIEVPAAQ